MVAGVVLAVVALVIAEFAARAYVSSSIKKDVSGHSGDSSSTHVAYGMSPVLPGVVTRKIDHVKMDIPNSLTITYPNGNTSAPDVTGLPAATITMDGLDINSRTADDVYVDITLPTDYIEAAAQGGIKRKHTPQDATRSHSSVSARHGADGRAFDQAGYSKTAQSITDRAIKVTAVHPNPSKGTFSLELSGGLADIELKPIIAHNDLAMKVTNAKLLGMALPQSVTDVLTAQMEDAVNMSDRTLRATHVEVTNRGLRLKEEGHNVDLKKLSDSADEVLGTNDSDSPHHSGDDSLTESSISSDDNPFNYQAAA